MDIGRLISSFFGPQSPGSIITGYAECLLLVLAVDSVRRGRRVYLGAVGGLALAIYARTAEGFIDPTLDSVLRGAGLVFAAAVLAFDLVFESAEGP
jgi:hypothetical protein